MVTRPGAGESERFLRIAAGFLATVILLDVVVRLASGGGVDPLRAAALVVLAVGFVATWLGGRRAERPRG